MTITKSLNKRKISPRLTDVIFDSRLPDHVVRIGAFTGVVNPIKMKCSKHGLYTASRAKCAMRKLGGCSECQRENSRIAKPTKLHEDYAKSVYRGTKGSIKVLGAYINSYTKIDHQCSCGRTWKVSPRSMLQNFGTCKDCVMHRRDVKCNYQYKTKEIQGTKFRVQGYEAEALVFLSKVGIDINKLVVHSISIPKFKYTYGDTARRYYPDFFYPKTQTVYEVKSCYTMGISDRNTFAKVKAKALSVISKGYNFRLIIGGINGVPPIIVSETWIDMNYSKFFNWLEECYGVTKNKTHGVLRA